MYVDDCAEAIRRITENGRIGQVYNIGTEFEIPNLHLTEVLHAKVEKLMFRYVCCSIFPHFHFYEIQVAQQGPVSDNPRPALPRPAISH
jgi:nucleoside-diphosphate-sugar epimerase